MKFVNLSKNIVRTYLITHNPLDIKTKKVN